MQLPALETLRCFCEAARLLSFRAAARAVALTPAALGQRIRQLENLLGVPVFERNTRRIVLTPAGLNLLPQARLTLEAATECLRVGSGATRPVPIEMLLGTRHELGMSWILPMLSGLEAAHPGLTLHLYFGAGSDLLIRVRTLEIDCAVGSMRVHDPKIDSIRLHREQYLLCGSPKLLRRQPLARLGDAIRHQLIDLGPELPLFSYYRDAPQGDRLSFGRIRMMGTTAAARQLVLAGQGVAVLPLYLVRRDLQARRLVPLLPQLRPLDDYSRLFFRANDPRRSIYEALARHMNRVRLT
jgi:DNA-binding transcriptional LysR family regulator